jgi:pimeloyl-ACP methyl ester carboxylesterase/DNA-binding CsgD family transcriptional regulator
MTASRGIRFFRFGARRIAYGLSGEGPLMVAPAWWVSHLELDWQHERLRRFWEAVADGFRLVRYDRPGVGLSDRDATPREPTLDAEVELLGAMLDELDCERATLVGGSSGGCTAVAFAARSPERVERLLLYGSFADGSSIAPVEVREAIVGAVRSHWGLGSRLLADVFLRDEGRAERDQFTRDQQQSCDGETAAALLEEIYRTDVRPELAHVSAPTVVVHRRADRAIPYELGRQLAAGIDGATLVPLAGKAHLPWAGDALAVARALRTGLGAAPRDSDPADPPAALLSPREREVLSLVAEGMTEQQIAERLVVSPHTVHRHMANIRAKLGRGSGASAVSEATRLGLI